MPTITPNLWFDGNAEEAAEFYCSVFPNSKITNVLRYTEAGPGEPGTILTIDFVLDGQPFTGINGGPQFTFDPAISFLVDCPTQADIDHYWDALLAGGGEPGHCGWLTDRFGVSWQVCPADVNAYLDPDDPQRARRATEALYQMSRIDLAAIQAAADGA